MTSVVLFDEPTVRTSLLPFTFTRPVASIRCGILTLAEKWQLWLNTTVSFRTLSYLQPLYPCITSDNYLFIAGHLCPDQALSEAIGALPAEGVLRSGKDRSILAVRTIRADWHPGTRQGSFKEQIYEGAYTSIEHLWDIYLRNGAQIATDYRLITQGRSSTPISDPFTKCYTPESIFIEPGATLRAAVLNAEGGPIYIGPGATVGEGAIIQGPFAMGEGAILGQGAKIRPNTTVGPYCKVGGEVNNSVLFGYSNKAHDGYLGNSVLGEWCNLGANTNNSNLKNDYTSVKLYSHASDSLEDTGQLFCGLFMGDYTKAGISTMFNTGTVVGVSANVFGAGFQPKHIPSFSWGGQAEGLATYRFEKAMAVIRATIHRRELELNAEEEAALKEIFESTQPLRSQF
jgi:UDP-N-acetylglucosamine diphosphorylase / glucose-1-phosphate thymidylyltransferase / UDP-N-acetylgalactosamine diphosphorylase / glucosamine-1-phosphate N-acetyltransferase / galactosamine-1-phosphate N-acetyltransferase